MASRGSDRAGAAIGLVEALRCAGESGPTQADRCSVSSSSKASPIEGEAGTGAASLGADREGGESTRSGPKNGTTSHKTAAAVAVMAARTGRDSSRRRLTASDLRTELASELACTAASYENARAASERAIANQLRIGLGWFLRLGLGRGWRRRLGSLFGLATLVLFVRGRGCDGGSDSDFLSLGDSG